MPIYFKEFKGRGFYVGTSHGMIPITNNIELYKSHKSESLFYCDDFNVTKIRTKNELFNLMGDEEI